MPPTLLLWSPKHRNSSVVINLVFLCDEVSPVAARPDFLIPLQMRVDFFFFLCEQAHAQRMYFYLSPEILPALHVGRATQHAPLQLPTAAARSRPAVLVNQSTCLLTGRYQDQMQR